MNSMNKPQNDLSFGSWRTKLAVSLMVAGATGSVAHADLTTTLTGTGLGNNAAIPAGHGSTIEAILNWSPDGGPAGATTNWDAYISWPNGAPNGVYQVDGQRPWISFTPVAGYRVGLDQFDFNVWSGGGGGNPGIGYELRIWAGTAPGNDGDELALFTGTALNNFQTYNSTQSTITTVNLNYLGAYDQALTIEFRQFGPRASYLAIDNFTFQTQAVPEPSSLAAISLLGLGASLMRRRRAN